MQENWDHIHKTFGSGFLLTRFISATVSLVCFCSLAIFLKHLHAVVYYCRTTFFLFFCTSNLVLYHNPYWNLEYMLDNFFQKQHLLPLLPCNEITRMESKFMSYYSITYYLWSFGSIFIFFSSRPMRRQKKLKSSLLAVPSRTLQGRWSRALRGFTLMQTGFRALKKRRISPRQWQS